MKTKKLRLSSETIRRLDEAVLVRVGGASAKAPTACSIPCTTTTTGGGGSAAYTCDPCSYQCETGGTACTAADC